MTCSAGFIDAIGYLTLRQIYVANMSGNTVAVAIHVSQRNWPQAWAHACPLLAFFPGLIAGNATVELSTRWELRAKLAPAVLLEAAGLGLFILIAYQSFGGTDGTIRWHGSLRYAVLVGLLAFAMGVQNGALRRIGGLQDVHTYVTGTLLAASNGCTSYLFWLGRRLRRFSRSRLSRLLHYTPRQRFLRSAALAASLWFIYVAGAILGAVTRSHFGVEILLTPMSILLLIALIDLIHPVGHRGHTASG